MKGTMLGLGKKARQHVMSIRSIAIAATSLTLISISLPAMAQEATTDARLRRVESEVRALQRQVFPNSGDGRVFTPEITGSAVAPAASGAPATTAMTDMLTRMDSLENQITKLTSQVEANSNRINQLEARLGGVGTVPSTTAPVATTVPTPTVTTTATTAAATATRATAVAATPSAAASTRPIATTSSARVAAVSAIVKPQTDDAGDDEYSYGYRLWEAKFYPEAQQQLKLFLERYPNHSRASFGRNLLGRAYLDNGNPREAATWFLQNYQNNKTGARAPDSVLYLAESMKNLRDTNRMCIALAEFADSYPAEAVGRLKTQFDALRNSAKCKS